MTPVDRDHIPPRLPTLEEAHTPVVACLPRDEAKVRPCNNACEECVSDPEALGATPLPRVPAGRDVVIVGYEPLLDRRLFVWMRAVQGRGGRVAALVTNGRLCLYEEVVSRLVRADVGLVIVKLFGTTEEEHDAHTRVPGSFLQATDGVRKMRAAGLRVALAFPHLREPVTLGSDGTHPCLDLAYRLTNTGPVVLPGGPRGAAIRPVRVGEARLRTTEERIGGLRYDAMVLTKAQGPFGPPLLPMVHVPLGMQCNNRCLYCNVRGGEDPDLRGRETVEAILDHAARTFLGPGALWGGQAALDFIGGEPTLHPDLPDLVARARDHGFPWVTVCTNGRRLAREGYLDRLVASGLNGVRFSMHDHRPGPAGVLAGRPDVGDSYVETARLLLARTDVVPYFYRILLAPNFDTLDDHLRWLAAHNRTGGPVRVHLGLPSRRGRMFENPSLFPPLHRVRDVVRQAVALAKDIGVEVTLFHAPGCLLPEAPHLSACLHVETLQVDAGTGAVVRLEFEGDAHHEEACGRCVWRKQCPGLPRYYHDVDPEVAAAWPVPFEAG